MKLLLLEFFWTIFVGIIELSRRQETSLWNVYHWHFLPHVHHWFVSLILCTISIHHWRCTTNMYYWNVAPLTRTINTLYHWYVLLTCTNDMYYWHVPLARCTTNMYYWHVVSLTVTSNTVPLTRTTNTYHWHVPLTRSATNKYYLHYHWHARLKRITGTSLTRTVPLRPCTTDVSLIRTINVYHGHVMQLTL